MTYSAEALLLAKTVTNRYQAALKNKAHQDGLMSEAILTCMMAELDYGKDSKEAKMAYTEFTLVAQRQVERKIAVDTLFLEMNQAINRVYREAQPEVEAGPQ